MTRLQKEGREGKMVRNFLIDTFIDDTKIKKKAVEVSSSRQNT